jgi:hypothetical protein
MGTWLVIVTRLLAAKTQGAEVTELRDLSSDQDINPAATIPSTIQNPLTHHGRL